MKGSPALEISGAIRNHFSDRDHQDGKGVDGQWWAGSSDVSGSLVPAALCREPSLPWPSRGQSQQIGISGVAGIQLQKWKVEKVIEPQLTQLLVPPMAIATQPVHECE